MNLAEASLPYRRPELYDELHHDPNNTTARQQDALINRHCPNARTILDLGCGTGRDLAHHADRFACAGVDVQSQMIAYARQQHPRLDLHVGDMRTVRLGRTFDVILSVGLTPSYLLDDEDLTAAFATFAAHAHTNTLLILQPLRQAPTPARHTFHLDTATAPGQVTVDYSAPADSQTVTMNRTWQLDDGTTAHDVIHRRVLSTELLNEHLTDTGFKPLDPQPDGDTHGYVVAHYTTAP